MNGLPLKFEERMKQMLGEEYDAFLRSYEDTRRPGLRVNTLREKAKTLESSSLFDMQPIPWAPHGYYYDPLKRPGKHPLHEAGAYYIQEPSAMAVAALSGVRPGMRVLDLCAAPGGKSTQLASMLEGEGILYSNEIHPARAKILSQNIERMGISNAVVLNEDPKKLAERFPLYFDTVVVDAPCSGEGMFRKEEEAIPNWSPENVELCARRQSGILDCAAEMTAPGGTLVYSTCTFAPQENEQNAAKFVMRHPEFRILDLPSSLGDYLAVFRKEGSALRRRAAGGKPVKDREAIKLFKEFCEETLSQRGISKLETGGKDGTGAVLMLFGKELYRIPECVGLDGLKVLRPGLHLGTLKKNRFEPSHALAAALEAGDVKCFAELSDGSEDVPGDGNAARAYLRGESLRTQDCTQISGQKGWCLVTDCGFSCGWGKLSGDQIKNHYPKGLRRPY